MIHSQSDRPLPSRRALLAGLIAAPGLLTRRAWAQGKYPTRPIKVVLPFGAGGVAYITVRIVTERLGDLLGQRFVMRMSPGQGGRWRRKGCCRPPPTATRSRFFPMARR